LQNILHPASYFLPNSYACIGEGTLFAWGKMMENRETQFTTNDLGLLVFVIVAGWLLLFQSGLFQ